MPNLITADQLHDHFLETCVFDSHTFTRTIYVDMETTEYLELLAEELDVDRDALETALRELKTLERIAIEPQIEPHIDTIEVYD